VTLLLAVALLAGPGELKRAKDRFEFGAYGDCAGTLRQYLATDPPISDAQAVDAYRMLGISEYHLGDQAQARAAFVNLLSFDPEFALDAFLVPPPIVDFFDKVKRENEPALAPLRDRRKALREQQRLAEEARRKLLAEEQARSGPPTKLIRVQERVYLFNWLPLGAGQFQNGDRAKGTAIAAGQVLAGLVNLGALVIHDQLANDRSRLCTSSQPGCGRPPYSDADRVVFRRVDDIKYGAAAVFWALYAYGVWDAHRHFVPVVETEIGPGGQPTGLGVGVKGGF
jgi:tetratricopeptide (TPR) repeat protein